MKPKRRIRAVAVLPTLFTLANLLCGFFAIVIAARIEKPDNPEALWANMLDWSNCAKGAGLIFLGMVFDAFDGYLARLSKSRSDFGAQLDSMADMITFGVAPAFLLVKMCPYMTYWYREAVWIIAALFAACVALRLARFNVETAEDDDHSYFHGLPSPAGGAAIASFAFMFYALHVWDKDKLVYAEQIGYTAEWFLPLFAVLVSGLMVSRIRYPHIVTHLIHGERSFRHIVGLLFALMLITVVGWYSVPILCSAFVFVGPAVYVWEHVVQGSEETREEPLF